MELTRLSRPGLAALLWVLACASAIPVAGAQERGPGRVPVDSLRIHPELDPDSGVELLGRPAREFRFARWIGSPALTPDSLRGRVVLIRFWTDDCRFCRNTLPAIETLRKRYADRGLVVVGAYHPNRPGRVRDAVVTRWAKEYGYGGPIAVDDRWRTLRHWWLDGRSDRNWVSVSFLLDRQGVVRWVHGGGEYHPSGELPHHRCDVAYAGLEREIDSLLR